MDIVVGDRSGELRMLAHGKFLRSLNRYLCASCSGCIRYFHLFCNRGGHYSILAVFLMPTALVELGKTLLISSFLCSRLSMRNLFLLFDC